MMRESIDLLEQSRRAGRIRLHPPAGAPFPGLRQLAAFAGGCTLADDESSTLSWTGPPGSEYFPDSPELGCLDLGHDVCGNAFVLLTAPGGEPAQVLWACHDPSMILEVSGSFAGFLQEWIASPQRLERRIEAASQAPFAKGISRIDALGSSVEPVRELAASLDERDWILYDLRGADRGRGFERDLTGPLRIHPRELVFAHLAAPPVTRKAWWKFWTTGKTAAR